MFDSAGKVRLVDFGLAIESKNKIRECKGTPYFMAPE
jgi:serine/threonine protein kinase